MSGGLYLFLVLLSSFVSLLSSSPMSMALFLVFSVLFSCLYLVFIFSAPSWLSYILALLFIGGVLVVLLILTSLSGVSLFLGCTSLFASSFFICSLFLFLQFGYFSVFLTYLTWEAMWVFVASSSWSLGLLGCLGCLLFLWFLGLISITAGALRKLLEP